MERAARILCLLLALLMLFGCGAGSAPTASAVVTNVGAKLIRTLNLLFLHHRQIRLLIQHLKQGFAEAGHIIRVRCHQRTVQVFHRNKGKHPFFLRIVIVYTIPIPYCDEVKNIVTQFLRSAAAHPLHHVLKVLIGSVHKYTDGFPLVRDQCFLPPFPVWNQYCYSHR